MHKFTTYVVQIMGSNSRAPPHWMNVAYRGTRKAAETEREWLVAHGIKPDDIRIVKFERR